jgi:hypothetical protein
VTATEQLLDLLGVPSSIAEMGISKEQFEKAMPDLAKIAFDDPSWRSNPRMPLVSELIELFWSAYNGRGPKATESRKQEISTRHGDGMTMTVALLKVDPRDIAQSLTDAREKLNGAECEVVLDFSGVSGIDPAGIRAMEGLAGAAEAKSAKLVLRGINVDVYKVLKLARLANRFSFAN